MIHLSNTLGTAVMNVTSLLIISRLQVYVVPYRFGKSHRRDASDGYQ